MPPPDAWRPFIDEAYANGWFTNFGPLSRRLEAAFTERWGGPATSCVAASSATAALAAPLIANAIEGGVLLPAFTFPATLGAVKSAGARPLLIDVAREDWTIAPSALDEALSRSGARAVVLGAPFGFRRDFAPHAAVARKHGALVIIDNAAGVGVARRALETEPGFYEVYSLHATKPFAAGEGGMIFANAADEERLRAALNFGLVTAARGETPLWGINGKLSEIHAAIGLAALQGFERRIAQRRALAGAFSAALSPYEGVRYETDASAAAWQVFPVLMPSRGAADGAVATARARGMEVRRYYSPSLSALGVAGAVGRCEVSEDLAARMCCFPVYAGVSDVECAIMIDTLIAAVEAGLARA